MKRKIYLGGEDIREDKTLPKDIMSFFRSFAEYLRKGWRKK